MFRLYTLFLALFIPFSLHAHFGDSHPLPPLSLSEKAGIQIMESLDKKIPQNLAVFASAAAASYYGSSKIAQNPLFRTLATLAGALAAYKIFDHYSWGYDFVPGTLFNTHPSRLARDWNKYLKMDVLEKNALLDESYPEFLKKLYTNAEIYDHPIREANKLTWLEQELKETANMGIMQQKWHMLKVKRAAYKVVSAPNL